MYVIRLLVLIVHSVPLFSKNNIELWPPMAFLLPLEVTASIEWCKK